MPGLPPGVTGVSVTEAVPLNTLLITVLTEGGTLAQTTCLITPPPPPPGPAWGTTYCAAFKDITPPSG
ncbi:hypothetical protein ACGFNP_39750 [Nonomuraea sp. NPDC049269]|uniref:hypothetical protein n=1 Tax=Nonomuraea sp. NPDC049269 TaxID=3364349 RepID=UPI003719E240